MQLKLLGCIGHVDGVLRCHHLERLSVHGCLDESVGVSQHFSLLLLCSSHLGLAHNTAKPVDYALASWSACDQRDAKLAKLVEPRARAKLGVDDIGVWHARKR